MRYLIFGLVALLAFWLMLPQPAAVTLDKQWQDYSIERTKFINADLTNITSLSWVAAQQPQTFEFSMDDIALK